MSLEATDQRFLDAANEDTLDRSVGALRPFIGLCSKFDVIRYSSCDEKDTFRACCVSLMSVGDSSRTS